MSRRAVRRAVLVVHVATSVGWFGALLAYSALDIAATVGGDAETVRSSYGAMNLVAQWVIVPLAVAANAVGVVNALVTPWGVIRHYWVIAKLVLSLLACAVLIVELRVVSALAATAAAADDPRSLPGTLPHSIGGAVVLALVIGLSVYKPRGATGYGWRAGPS